MDNPYTCDNCIFNPSQYRRLGTATGYCLKHSTLLFKASATTCRFHKRKDLPHFVCEEGSVEHSTAFSDAKGVVFYYNKGKQDHMEYSERHAWDTSSFDPNLNEVSIYHRSQKKWILLESFLGAKSPTKSVMHSSLCRRYIQQCGPSQDNYRIALGVAYELGRTPAPEASDFAVRMPSSETLNIDEETISLYQKDIELLKLYCVQEYGQLVNDEEITWISDKLNGAFEEAAALFIEEIKALGGSLIRRIIEGARERGTYFKWNDA